MAGEVERPAVRRRDRRMVALGVAAVLAVTIVAVRVVVQPHPPHTAHGRTSGMSDAHQVMPSGHMMSGGSMGSHGAGMVHLSDSAIEPRELTVDQGATLEVVNLGTGPHRLAVEGTPLATDVIAANAAQTVRLGALLPGTYTLSCTVPGHRDTGMVATLRVRPAHG